MKNTRSIALVDHLEMLLARAMTSAEPIQINDFTEEGIPLRMLQVMETYVSDWKSLGFERSNMADCFHNPLVREAVQKRFPFRNQEEIERLKNEWDQVLAFNRKSMELADQLCNQSSCDAL